MEYIVSIEIMLYYLTILLYCQNTFLRSNRLRWPVTVLCMLGILLSYAYADIVYAHWYALPVIWVMMMLALRFTTNMDWLQSFGLAGFLVICHYGVRGVLTSVLALVLIKVDPSLPGQSMIYEFVTLGAIPLTLFLLDLFRKKYIAEEKLIWLMQHKRLIIPITIYEVVAAINMIILNFGRGFPFGFQLVVMENNENTVIWYACIVMMSRLLTIGMLIYLTYHLIQSSILSDYRIKSLLLEEQNELLLRHYKTYQRYSDNTRAFRHDCQSLLVSIDSLLDANEIGKAREVIQGMNGTLMNKKTQHKAYANSVVLDAMMRNFVELCEENEIKLTLKSSPIHVNSLSNLDAMRIFHNVTNNAVEACLKLPVEQRFIEYMAWNENGWCYLQTKNAYDGQECIRNGKLYTTKQDTENHGLGMYIMTEVVEKAGGFINFTADSSNQMFVLQVMVPQNTHESIAQ